MSGLEHLNTRLRYQGGDTDGRIKKDKVDALKDALWNSYQAETAILNDGKEFRCLINPNKETGDYDDKIISIPYRDKCLFDPMSSVNHQCIKDIRLKCGDVFTWKETNTHWLVFLQYLEEKAYFKAQIRKCEYQIDINGKKYWVYIRGPVETKIIWNQKGGVEWNDLNYSLIMFISKDDITEEYFHRFTKIKITNPATGKQEPWQVANANPYYGDNMIQVFMAEDFSNTIEEEAKKEEEGKIIPPSPPSPILDIEGPLQVISHDRVSYKAIGDLAGGGKWYINEHEYSADNPMSITISTKDNFKLRYSIDDDTFVEKEIKVMPI